jgi:hypothetical protein
MDNPRLILLGRGQTTFILGMQIAFKLTGNNTEAKYWWMYKRQDEDRVNREKLDLLGETKCKCLVLSWASGDEEKHKSVLPAFMDCPAATSFAWNWLSRQEYGPEPDYDGSNEKGFLLFNETWGHVGGDHYAIVAIAPAWAMLGK